jgi:hypothetical protein
MTLKSLLLPLVKSDCVPVCEKKGQVIEKGIRKNRNKTLPLQKIQPKIEV